jgi:hypothetical protein
MMFGQWSYRRALELAQNPPEQAGDPGKWRSQRIYSAFRWFGLYVIVGMVTLMYLTWPVDFIGGVTTDLILVVVVLKGVRIWDSRIWHAEGSDAWDPIQACNASKGLWRCVGMAGHLGPHDFGPLDD